jgi:TusA-related sulfurtransferase
MQGNTTTPFENSRPGKNETLKKVTEKDEFPFRNELYLFHTEDTQEGALCALLTPAIKAKLREMLSNQVLEVRVNDPLARGDIEAWCRLSGNSLVKVSEVDGGELRFFIRKK